MFRKGKFWLILVFGVLASLLASVVMISFAFRYDGIHWYDADLPVTWEINQNGTADCTGEFQAVRAAYGTWEDVAGSYFTETYVGATALGGPELDGHNVILWGDTQDSIATCYYWYYTTTGRLVEFDIVFDDYYSWSSTGEAGKMDVQNIATHEFGHTLSLGDLYEGADTQKTMYGYGSLGETKKRTLHQDDIDGICYIYRESEPEPENRPPNVPSPPTGPTSGTPGASYSFTAATTDPDGDDIALKFSWGDGGESAWTSFVDSASSASMSYSWSGQGTYEVRVKAKDTNGAESGWSGAHQIVTGHPPNTPQAPTGPDSGTHGPSYSFSTTTTDPDGNDVAFKFSWGDGTESGWTSFVKSGSSGSMSYSWSGQRAYEVRAKAKDTYGGESGWSAAHEIVIGQPPATPSSPSGTDGGLRDVSYSFSATTTDPDGDDVAFKFDWGDGTESGWTSFVSSGGSVGSSHSWSSEGAYYAKVKAKDTFDAESGWSAGHEIVIRAILLEVDPSSLDFAEVGRGSPGTMGFRAYNAGSGTLSGNVSVNQNWITVSPTSFEENDNTVYVTIETGMLGESLSPYAGTVTVISNGGTKSVQISVLVIPTGVVAYPNPFSLAGHASLTFWGTYVPQGKIQIFTTAGELVRTLVETAGVSKLSWDGRNEEGARVARGIYIYVAKDSRGKIAVLR